MQVTPTNALFSALSTQIQPLQKNTQNQTRTSGATDDDVAPQSTKIETDGLEAPHTVINASGQIETDDGSGNINFREAPLAGSSGGGQGFIAPGSIVDIKV